MNSNMMLSQIGRHWRATQRAFDAYGELVILFQSRPCEAAKMAKAFSF